MAIFTVAPGREMRVDIGSFQLFGSLSCPRFGLANNRAVRIKDNESPTTETAQAPFDRRPRARQVASLEVAGNSASLSPLKLSGLPGFGYVD